MMQMSILALSLMLTNAAKLRSLYSPTNIPQMGTQAWTIYDQCIQSCAINESACIFAGAGQTVCQQRYWDCVNDCAASW